MIEYDSNKEIIITGHNLKTEGNLSINTGKSSKSTTLANIDIITDNMIKIKLSQLSSNLNMGINKIQLVYSIDANTYSSSSPPPALNKSPSNKKFEYKSNIFVLMLVPKITLIINNDNPINPITDNLIFHFIPPLTEVEKQNVSVVLDNNTIKIPPENIETTPTDNILTIRLPPSISDKLYYLRVLVEDTISLLRADKDSNSPTFNKLLPVIEIKRGL